MSASTERKNRIAAREAGTDKKTIAAREEAEKKAKSRRKWTWGTIGVFALILAIILLNSGLMYTATTALTANGTKYSPAQVNYYYGNDYLTLANQYGSYASYIGLDTSMGLSGLGNQQSGMGDGSTWRDYFRNSAKTDVQQTRAMLDYAAENGITLSDEEISEIDDSFAEMENTAKSLGYRNADALYSMNYGSGVTAKIVRQAALDSALASKAYTEKSDSLSYTEEELEEYYQSLSGDRDLFDFNIYYVSAETVEQEEPSESGEDTVSMVATEDSRIEAKATANAIVYAFLDGSEIEDLQERFAVAVESQTEEQPTQRSGVSGSSLPEAYAEWLKGPRTAGNISVFADADEDPAGYTVVMFLGRNDNHYATQNVRHILIKAVADDEGNYTDEAKAEAQSRAQEILDEFLAGEQTEERFAELAEEYSEDGGSNTNGGLYENIPLGQMVAEFEDFCYGDHQPGDTGIVYGESSSYAGYHVMYYVGEGQQYSDSIAESDLKNTALSEWSQTLYDACEVTEGFGFRFVGK